MKLATIALGLFFLDLASHTHAASLSKVEQLGKAMYHDKDFSYNGTQSCQTCHHPNFGFADPTNSRDPYYTVVSLGDDGVSVGGRNAPSAAYAGFSPILQQQADQEWVGGMFWDGRATGWTLQDPLAEQAQGPPLNPVEMNMPDKESIVQVIREASYVNLFLQVFGSGALDNIDEAYDDFATAVAAYERSVDVQQFTSRYDMGILSEKELRGLDVFEQKCALCHVANNGQELPLFTNYTYHNIGIPANPLLAGNAPDLGLGGFLAGVDGVDAASQNGKFKVPTLRNVALTAPYGHNGYFATLHDILRFKNTRDIAAWADPEINENINYLNLGNLGMTEGDIDDVVAFLTSLTDN